MLLRRPRKRPSRFRPWKKRRRRIPRGALLPASPLVLLGLWLYDPDALTQAFAPSQTSTVENISPRSAVRTFLTLVFWHVADAAFACSCSDAPIVVRWVSSKQPLKSAFKHQTLTALSMQRVHTDETRSDPTSDVTRLGIAFHFPRLAIDRTTPFESFSV